MRIKSYKEKNYKKYVEIFQNKKWEFENKVQNFTRKI